jgi:putative transposase
MRLDYPVPLLSRMLKVSLSGYYDWLERPQSNRAKEEMRLGLEIKATHHCTRQAYRAERMQHGLAEHGVSVGICRLKRIRR